MPGAFVIARDARGSFVHVRRRDDGECVGCLEVGLYEIVRAIIVAETEGVIFGDEGTAVADIVEGTPAPPPPRSDRTAARAGSVLPT
jgi:hypothetical protein